MADDAAANSEERAHAIAGLRETLQLIEAGNTRWSAFVADNLREIDLAGLPPADDPYWIEVAGWHWAQYTVTIAQHITDLGEITETDPAHQFSVWAILLSTVTRLPGLAGRLDLDEAIDDAVAIAHGIMEGLPVPDEIWHSFRRLIPPRPADPPGTSLDAVLARGEIRAALFRPVIDAYNEAAKGITPGPKKSSARRRLPDLISQTTAMEVRQAGQALAEGPHGRHWVEASGEIALYHIVPGVPVQVRLAPDTSLPWMDRAVTTADLWDEVRRAGLTATIALQVLIEMVIQQERITLSLDEIIRLVGLDPRREQERQEQRRLVWHWIKLASRCQVVGERPGKYPDIQTGKPLNLETHSPLISITEIAMAKPRGVDGSEPPLEVEIVAGAFLARFRKNRGVLQYLASANVRKIAGIPAKQASGVFARSAGLALNQLWREGVRDAIVSTRTGEDNHVTVRNRRPFTRRQIYALYPPNPSLEDLLASDDPGRAKKYCDQAFTMLSHGEHKIIGYMAPLEPLPTRRKGWQDPWLDQPLDIRATPEVMKELAELHAASRRHRKKRGAPKVSGTA